MIDKVEEKIDLFERHVEVLEHVAEDEPIGIGALSEKTGLKKHRVRYSLRILEEKEVIEPSTEGAVLVEGAGDRISESNKRVDFVIERSDGLKIEVEE